MSSKLIFTVSSVKVCEQVVEALRLEGVEEESISVLGNASHDLSDLPDGGTLENDILPAVQRGAVIGGTAGLLAGLGALTIAPGLVIAGAAVALATAGGASVGALGSALIGTSVPNSRLREYQEAVERGELLLVVDVEQSDHENLQVKLLDQFPDIEFEGVLDPTPPVV